MNCPYGPFASNNYSWPFRQRLVMPTSDTIGAENGNLPLRGSFAYSFAYW